MPVTFQASVKSVECDLTVIRGEDLAPKDVNFLTGTRSSDPYVQILLNGTRKLGTTRVIKKNLSPTWDYSVHFKVGEDDWKEHRGVPFVRLKIFDFDLTSRDDLMGVVDVEIPTDNAKIKSIKWHPVPKDSAKNAKGRIQVSFKAKVKKHTVIVPGNAMDLYASKLHIGLAWDMLSSYTGSGIPIDLDASCVAVTEKGQISLLDSVYYGNLSNPSQSIIHSGDETTGQTVGDDEYITLDLYQIPQNIRAMYIILMVATRGKTFKDVESAFLRVENAQDNQTICCFTPAKHVLSSNSTAMFQLRIARGDVPNLTNPWVLRAMEETHPTARDFGSLIPYIKKYTTDIIPSITVDISEQVALMRKGQTVNIGNYCAGNKLPQWMTFGLAWDVTNGRNIDLDACALCLNDKTELLQEVSFHNLSSKDGAIQHGGDEEEGDEVGDDEVIHLNLRKVKTEVKYIVFGVNSFDGVPLDGVSRAACHLFDKSTGVDLAAFALTKCSTLNGQTGLLAACLHRGEKDPTVWYLTILAEPNQGRSAEDTKEHFQRYLKTNKLSGGSSVTNINSGNYPTP